MAISHVQVETFNARDFVADLIQHAKDGGASLPESGQQALDTILRQDRAAEVLEGLGPEPLIAVWRAREHSARAAAFNTPTYTTVQRQGPAMLDFAPGSEADNLPIPQVIPVEARKPGRSIFETLWPVEGRWVRMGELTKGECVRVATWYGKQEQGLRKQREAFEQLAELMEDDKLPLSLQIEAARVKRIFGDLKP